MWYISIECILLLLYSSIISANIMGSDSFLRYANLYLGKIPPKEETVPLTRSTPNFEGSIQQLQFNGLPYLEQIRNGLSTENVDYKITATWTPTDDIVYHAVTFKSHNTYMGLPQMKAYADIDLYFQIKTLEPNGKHIVPLLCK